MSWNRTLLASVSLAVLFSAPVFGQDAVKVDPRALQGHLGCRKRTSDPGQLSGRGEERHALSSRFDLRLAVRIQGEVHDAGRKI